MNDTPDPRPAGETLNLDEIEAKATHGQSIITALCSGHRSWTMSIPARPDDDPDLVLSEAISNIPALVAEVRRIRALLADAPAVWVATDASGESGIYGALPGLYEHADGCYFAGPSHPALTPPGTCVRYRLVADPEETP